METADLVFLAVFLRESLQAQNVYALRVANFLLSGTGSPSPVRAVITMLKPSTLAEAQRLGQITDAQHEGIRYQIWKPSKTEAFALVTSKAMENSLARMCDKFDMAVKTINDQLVKDITGTHFQLITNVKGCTGIELKPEAAETLALKAELLTLRQQISELTNNV